MEALLSTLHLPFPDDLLKIVEMATPVIFLTVSPAYDEVEFLSCYETFPDSLRAYANKLGLTLPIVHLRVPNL